jgi:hypothetical protein
MEWDKRVQSNVSWDFISFLLLVWCNETAIDWPALHDEQGAEYNAGLQEEILAIDG